MGTDKDDAAQRLETSNVSPCLSVSGLKRVASLLSLFNPEILRFACDRLDLLHLNSKSWLVVSSGSFSSGSNSIETIRYSFCLHFAFWLYLGSGKNLQQILYPFIATHQAPDICTTSQRRHVLGINNVRIHPPGANHQAPRRPRPLDLQASQRPTWRRSLQQA